MADDRLRLLVLIADISAGTGTFCKQLGRGLREQFGHEIRTMLLLLRHRDFTAEERAAYEELHCVGAPVSDNWRRWYETPLDALRLAPAIRRLRPDLVFGIGTYANLLGSVAAGSRRTIMSEHMNMSLRLKAARFGGVIGRLMRWRHPHSLIVAAARGITQDLESHFGARRTRVIPNGLDAEQIRRRAAGAALPLPFEGPFYIAVGRLTPQKDYPTLLRAFAEARRQGMAERLAIAGDGELRGELESLARELGVAQWAHFLGHQPNPYPIIRQAGALVLSSVFEGFAYVPLEAMALGLPVIATDCPSGPGEILGGGEFGLLARPGDVQGLAAAMLRLSRDPAARAHFARQSAARSAQLSVESMTRQYRDLFFEEYRRLRHD